MQPTGGPSNDPGNIVAIPGLSYSDDPIDSAGQDLLGRVYVARSLATLAVDFMTGSSSSVLAIAGPWGSGKSSVVNLAKSVIADSSPKSKIVEFSPWIFSDYVSMLIGFFGMLGDALPQDRRKVIRKSMAKYAKAVAPASKVASPFLGFDPSSALTSIANVIEKDSSLKTVRAETRKLLQELEYPILVVIDDLDRLHPDELLLVFKLIREVARFPNVHYLLAYDHRTILDLLMQTDLARGDRRRAVDYVDKIVQARIDIPPLIEQDHRSLFLGHLQRTFERCGFSLSESKLEDLYDRYRRHMNRWTIVPRTINKLFTQLEASYPPLHGEVHFEDFFILTYLRTFENALYSLLPSYRSDLTGALDWTYVPKSRSGQAPALSQIILQQAGVPDEEQPQLIELLMKMFSAFDPHGSGRVTDERSLAREQRAESDAYFDRYFQLRISPNDVSDQMVLFGLRDIASASRTEATAAFARSIKINPMATLRKAEILIGVAQLSNYTHLIEWTADMYPILSREHEFAQGSASAAAEDLIVECLNWMDPDDGRNVVNSVLLPAQWRILLEIAARHFQKERGMQPYWLSSVRSNLIQAVRWRVDELTDTPIESIQREDFYTLYRWSQVESPEAVRAHVWPYIRSGKWSLLGYLGQLVGEKLVYGVPTRLVLGELTRKELESFTYLDEVFESLSKDIDNQHMLLASFDGKPPTRENREAYVLAFLAMLREQAPSPAEPGEPETHGT